MLNLDEVDIRILRALMKNSRASISNIARELGLSRPTVRKRIRRLVELGVIKGFTVMINENLLKGFQLMCYFKAANIADVLKELRGLDEITDIYLTTGERNVVCIARVIDLKSLEGLLEKFSNLGVPFEVSMILSVEKKLPPIFTSMVKLTCDYCGKEITGKPITYTIHNREFYLCCPTCYREFRRNVKAGSH